MRKNLMFLTAIFVCAMQAATLASGQETNVNLSSESLVETTVLAAGNDSSILVDKGDNFGDRSL